MATEFPRIYNAAADMVDRNVEQGRADKAAFIDPERSLTYGELKARTNQVANMLAGHGLKREMRVAMIMLDTVDFPCVFWGAIKAGIVPVALNTLLTTEQYRYMLDDCRAEMLIVSKALLPTVEPILGELAALKTVIVSEGDNAAHPSLAAEISGQSEDFTLADTCADETAFWLYSSGSTGSPKGVRHVHTSPMFTALRFGIDTLGFTEDDVVFSAAKLFFAYGLGNGMSMPMAVGATTLLLPGRPTPESVFEILRQHQPTFYFGVPTLYAAILADPSCTPAAGSARLKMCVSAGEALPEEVGQAWKDRFGVDIIDGVGSTEMLHIFLANRPGDVRYGTSGRPISGYSVRLVDENDAEVADGEIGELLVNGSSSADAYWNQREKTRNTFQGNWTRTGDKYFRDEDGYFRYCGRTDDMFKVSGIWVSPFEVESALISHSAVLEAAVVPHADEEDLLKPKAFVVLKPGESSEGLYEVLKDHVKEKSGRWKYPRWIEFVDDLPKTATGKIQRFKLR